MRRTHFPGIFGTLLLTLTFCVLSPNVVFSQSVVTTFAGTDYVFTGDGRPAIQAQLGLVVSVAVDPWGNVYTGDAQNHLIYRISPEGTLTVFGGNGIAATTGDGGPALQAAIAAPVYLAIGPRGDLFIGDSVAGSVRRIDTNGVVTTVSAVGFLSGMTLGQDGTLYVVTNNRVRKMSDGALQDFAGNGSTRFTGDGPATATGMDIEGMATDASGNLYIADGFYGAIRKVTPDGNLTTIAGGGSSTAEGAPALQTRLRFPTGVAVDALGNIYVAEADAAVIRRIGPDQSVRTVAGNLTAGFGGDGGPATAATLGTALGLAVDTHGSLYIADGENLRIRQVGTDGTIRTLAGLGQTRFSGDGGPAINATFSIIRGMAMDSAGNLYVSDAANHRVRLIRPDGTIQTVAGTGVAGDTGDEGPGTSAALLSPAGLATTPAGDLFIADRSPGSRRIRRLGADGIMHAAAGKPGSGPTASFSLPIDAQKVQIGDPVSVATDTAGNLVYLDSSYSPSIFLVHPDSSLGSIPCSVPGKCPPINTVGEFVSDYYSLQIITQVAIGRDQHPYVAVPRAGVYRIEADGSMTILAGNGQFIPPYDSADGITFDNDGRVVFTNNFHVYRIDSNGIANIAGGNLATVADQGDGGSATSATMFPTSPVYDKAGNLYVADQVTQRVRVILAQPPEVSAAPASLSFSGISQGPVSLPQQISINSAIPSLAFSITTTTSDEGNWLQVSTASGLTPRLVDVTADPSSLRPGDYTGTVTIAVPLASPKLISIAVSLHVGPAIPPQPVLNQQNLSFTYARTGTPRAQTLVLSNAGGGTIPFQVSAATTTGGPWLSLQVSPAVATPSSPARIVVMADPSNLPPQTYRGTVQLQFTDGTSRSVPVTMTVSAADRALLLSQTGLSFTAVNGGGVTPPISFQVVNVGLGTVTWTATISTLAGGPDWLQVDRTAGSSTAGDVPPGIQVSVRAANLNPGPYYGLVRVNAAGAANTPQVVTVFLKVLPRGSDPGALVDPSELQFVSVEGGPTPGSQSFLVYNVAAAAKSYRSTAAFDDHRVMTILPASATLDPDQPTRVIVQPISAGIPAAGVHNGVVSLQFNDGTVRSVKVRWIVVPAGQVSSTGKGAIRRAAGDVCVPTNLIPSFVSLSSSYLVTSGWPVAVELVVKDDCGRDLVVGSVTVTFSTGDAPLSLQPLLDGRWAGTWQSASGIRTTATLKAQARSSAGITGENSVELGLNQPEDPPSFAGDGVASAAGTPAFTPIAPGSLLTISGARLAEVAQKAGAPPLPFSMGNAQVLIGGIQAPLVDVRPDRIELIVPYGLGANTSQQILITRGSTYSRPLDVDVALAQPAVFPMADGSGPQIFALRGANATPVAVTAANPAVVGDTLMINCAGLGPVTPAPADGTLPGPTAAVTSSPVYVMFGATQVQADVASLSTGQIGQYQVRVKVPNTVPVGVAVPVTILVTGQTSPAVNIRILGAS